MGGQWASRGCAHDGAYLPTAAATGGAHDFPDVATDGAGGTGTMHTSNRLIETSWRTAKIVVKAPEN